MKPGNANNPEHHLKLPSALEAEKAALGACLVSNQAPQIDPHAFYHDRHRVIATAMQALAARSLPIDLVTVWDALHNTNQAEVVGGAAYLAELTELVPNADNLAVYQQIVARKQQEREIILTCHSLSSSERIDPSTVAASLNKLRDASERLTQSAAQTPMTLACQQLLATMEERRINPSSLLGLSTGINDLDQALSGLCKSDLIVIAARAGIGKTAFATTLSMNIASAGHSVMFFSLEMARDQLLYRMIASHAGVDLLHLRSGTLSQVEYARAISALHTLSSLPILIDDSPALSELDIIRRSKEERPAVILIDYLQYIKPSASQERRDLEVGLITRAMKALAKELDVPVVLLAQLNRKLEERADKRPMLSDLRESGAIEMDADIVLFLYDDSAYHIDTQDQGIAELIIGKQRNGPKSTIPVAYHKQTTTFRDLAADAIRAFWQRRTKKKG